MPKEEKDYIILSFDNDSIIPDRKLYYYIYLNLPPNVNANPKTLHIVFPSFQPCITDAVKLIGIPNIAMIASAKIRFISSRVNSSRS